MGWPSVYGSFPTRSHFLLHAIATRVCESATGVIPTRVELSSLVIASWASVLSGANEASTRQTSANRLVGRHGLVIPTPQSLRQNPEPHEFVRPRV